MSTRHDRIDDDLATWISQQPLFFVATAPLAAEGHVNCSPRGLDCFRILGEGLVGWLDLTGSGAETAAHLRENGRIVLMFCAFQGPPRILRLHGRGRIARPGSEEWERHRAQFPPLPGARALVLVEVSRVSTSCGYGVPLMDAPKPRETLLRWAEKRSESDLEAYREAHNRRSIDGMDSL